MIATPAMFQTSSAATVRAVMHAGPVSRVQPAPAPRPRWVVSPDQLVEEVNRHLATRTDCDGLEMVAGRLHPTLPDAEGCNWNPGGLQLRVAHGPSTRALAGVREVLEWARLHYDLADDN